MYFVNHDDLKPDQNSYGLPTEESESDYLKHYRTFSSHNLGKSNFFE